MIDRVDPLIGATIDGRYRIDTRLAQGGFGAIYRAHDAKANRAVALKVLHQRFVSDEGTVARFRREGATLTTLKSPYTIAAYAIGESKEHGILYIVMELLHGVSLYERFRAQGPIPWRTMAKITRQVCDALAEAHALGIVHRDLKPTNIHLEDIRGDKDHVKVLDFGIAKILQAGQASTLESADLTSAGQMIGTLDYMSPEQMVGGALTGQTDIYTLGIVTYEMVAGKRPFAEAPTVAGVLAAMLKTKPPPLTRFAAVPAELDRIVQRCLAQKVDVRYPDVRALAADLDALLAGQPDDADSTRQMTVDPNDLRDAGASDGMTAVTVASDGMTAVTIARPGFGSVEMPGLSGESTVVSGAPLEGSSSSITPISAMPISTLPGVQPPDHVRDRLARISQMPPFAPAPDEEETVALGARNPLIASPPRDARLPAASGPSAPSASSASSAPARDDGSATVPFPLAPLEVAPSAHMPPARPTPPPRVPHGRPTPSPLAPATGAAPSSGGPHASAAAPPQGFPPTPYPSRPPASQAPGAQVPRAPLDLGGRMRDAMTRRTVWISVLVCAALLGIGVAARCS